MTDRLKEIQNRLEATKEHSGEWTEADFVLENHAHEDIQYLLDLVERLKLQERVYKRWLGEAQMNLKCPYIGGKCNSSRCVWHVIDAILGE